jgi:hypothetical protein
MAGRVAPLPASPAFGPGVAAASIWIGGALLRCTGIGLPTDATETANGPASRCEPALPPSRPSANEPAKIAAHAIAVAANRRGSTAAWSFLRWSGAGQLRLARNRLVWILRMTGRNVLMRAGTRSV